MQRLRELEIEEQPAADELGEEKVYSPLQLLDPSIVRQQSDLWLREIAKKYNGRVHRKSAGVRSQKRSLVIVISDAHWGKETCDFNMEVASQRILSITDHLVMQELPEFDEIVIALLGDLVEGEGIFDTQANLIEAPVIAAHKRGTQTIWKLCKDLEITFSLPIRVECVPGNHGRQSKQAHPQSNWDNAIAQSLEMISEETSDTYRIGINTCLDGFNVVDIKGARVLLNHTGIKHLGTPAMIQKFAGWIISKDIDVLVHGHWHSRALDTYLGRSRICNGCVCGGDDLGEKIAREDPPSQVYFLIDPEKPGFVSNFDYIQW
jgi:calcineurin-like phosphoesterase family protein